MSEVAALDSQRLLDLAIGVPVFVVTLPLQAVIGLAVRRQLGSPVIFRQDRPGRGGKVFRLRKFRTMLPVDDSTDLLDDASRLTPFGHWLRSTSLDELPTLWNVIRGDMSLVGPRPLLVEYLDRYTAEQARRHEVRPGVTGLAQVRGRNGLSWDEKFHWDLEYVENRSLLGDLGILVETMRTVVRREGIAHADSVSMPFFTGEHPQERAA